MAPAVTILIADDEIAIAEFIVDALQDEGFSVYAVHDGASAVQAVRTHQPALLILDYSMPRMNGAQVLAALRAGDIHLPVILIIADLQIEPLLRERITAFLPKPFMLDALLQCVATVLRTP